MLRTGVLACFIGSARLHDEIRPFTMKRFNSDTWRRTELARRSSARFRTDHEVRPRGCPHTWSVQPRCVRRAHRRHEASESDGRFVAM